MMENKILKTSKTKWDPKKEDEDIIILKTITPHDTHSLIIFQTFFFHLCYKKSHLLRAKCKENLVLFFKAGFDYNRESNTPIMQPLFKKENKVTYPGKGKGKG